MTLVENKLTDVYLTLAERMKDPNWMRQISLQKENYMPLMETYPWDVSSLSHGYPGFITLFSELDAFDPNQGWDLVAHQYILDLIQIVEEKGVRNSSLFSGLTGICFSIHLASKKGTRYQKILSQLNAILIKKIEIEYLQPIEDAFKTKKPISPLLYDVISGISGVIGYVLEFSEIDVMRTLAFSLVKALTNLNTPILYNGTEVPGWYVSQEHLLREEYQSLYRNGCFDTGLAHGVTGCLSALSEAYLKGIVVDHQIEAIEAMSSWLQRTKINFDLSGPIWPGRLGLNLDRRNQVEILKYHYRDGWCYGAPGIAVSLYQASKALKSDQLKIEAIQVMIGVCKRFSVKINLECVTFCHGLSGLLTMLHSMYLETKINIFAETSSKMRDLIVKKYDPSLPFGFKTITQVPDTEENLLIDNAGLLEGVTGTLLSLLFSTSTTSRDWTKVFLIK